MPGRCWSAWKVSGPFVRTVRSRAPVRAAAARITVDDASNATVPVSGMNGRSFAAI